MDYKQYEDLKYMLCEELEKIVEKGELTAGSLETVHKLTDSIKNVDKINMLEEGEMGNSMDDGYWTAEGSYDDGRMSYRNGGSYERGGQGGRGGSSYRGGSYRRGGNSYREGGNSYRRGRDSMGRFTSREGAKDEMMMKLGEMMQEANEKERNILERAMRQLENA